MKEKRIRCRRLNKFSSQSKKFLQLGEKIKKGTDFSRLQGNKIHIVLDTVINVTLALYFVNEYK